MRRVITLAVAGGLLLGLGVLQVASAGSEEAATPSSSGVVHRLQLTSVQDGHKTSFHGWVDSKARNWRIEIGPRTYIGTPTKYTVIDKTLGMTYEREGSPRFLGRLNDSSLLSSIERALYKSPRIHKQRATASPFGPTIRVRVGGRAVAATVIGRMSSVTAAKRRLFATTQQLGTNTEREVPVTAFSRIPVRAFWLGSQAVGLTATTSVERHITRSPEEIDLGAPAHSDLIARTFLYIPPQANGRTSAIPGFLTPPPGEVQIVSEPVRSAHAQKQLEAFNGQNAEVRYKPWPRSTATLGSGEKGTLIQDLSADARGAFAVVTETTFIYVWGDFDPGQALLIASKLRPLDP